MEADPVEAAMSGNLPDVPSSELRQLAVGASWFRELGMSEAAVEEALSDRQATPEEYEIVKNWKRTALNDPEWTKKWLSGDGEAKMKMVAANRVLMKGPRETAA
jgi:hypothetical protein